MHNSIETTVHGRIRQDDAARPLTLPELCFLALLSGAAVTAVEMLAFRLSSRYLGNSHYLFAAIIGSVLGGLSIGGYIGGRLSDRGNIRGLLARMFVAASVATFLVPSVNALMGEWSALWFLSWPTRIAIHAVGAFALPSAALGAIAPATARAALATGSRRGRIIGDIYAWGALGSIVGTFMTGFWLIESLGVYTGCHAIALLLAAAALWLNARDGVTIVWSGVTILLLLASSGPWPSLRAQAARMHLCESEDPDTLFEKESAYSQVRVMRDYERPGQLIMLLDKLKHSQFDPAHSDSLMYAYERVFAAVTAQAVGDRTGLRFLLLGGGGYTYPRDVLRRYAGAAVDVAEIDPVVTEAARSAFGLNADPRLSIHHADAREYLAQLDREGREAAYDFVFLDAFNDYIVPPHLTTSECLAMMKRMLKPDGVSVSLLVDALDSGRFLGSAIKTARSMFTHVDVICAADIDGRARPDQRATFVIVASDRDLGLGEIPESAPYPEAIKSGLLPRMQLDELAAREGATILTDDYAPVEQLLGDVISKAGADAPMRFYHRADAAIREGRFDEAIPDLMESVRLEPGFMHAWMNLGICQAKSGRVTDAEASLLRAVSVAPLDPVPLRNLGNLYFTTRRFDAAADFFARALRLDPAHARTWDLLGKSMGNLGRFSEAADSFEKARLLDSSLEGIEQNLTMARNLAAQSNPPDAASSRPAIP